MTETNRPLRLTREELTTCWAALNLGEPPVLLRLTGLSTPPVGERRRRLEAVLAEMAERGLTDGRRPVSALAAPLRLLARPEYLLDIRFTGPSGQTMLGLGAVAGADGLAVVGPEPGADGGGPVKLLAVDSTRIAGILLGLAGTIQPGRSGPVNVPADVLDKAIAKTHDDSVWTLADQLQARGVSGSEASWLARMCTGVRFGGQLGASTMREGRERRGGWVIGFHCADTGYFMNLRRDGTVTMCPTDGRGLARHWRELVDSLRPVSR